MGLPDDELCMRRGRAEGGKPFPEMAKELPAFPAHKRGLQSNWACSNLMREMAEGQGGEGEGGGRGLMGVSSKKTVSSTDFLVR